MQWVQDKLVPSNCNRHRTSLCSVLSEQYRHHSMACRDTCLVSSRRVLHLKHGVHAMCCVRRSMLQVFLYWLQDGRLYGDGWTPLMAAAVADRHSVAVRLLSAAGSAVGALVSHANRYGQTAVHIAARKGSLPLLTALLAIGGPAIAAVSSLCYIASCRPSVSGCHDCLSCRPTQAVC